MDSPHYSDAAKRCSAIITQASFDGYHNHWVAIRLSDGGSDGNIYFSRGAAVARQLHESLCAYFKIPLDGMPPQHAERMLNFHRMVYDGGFRLTDPDDPRHVVIPHNMEDYRKEMRQWLAQAVRRGHLSGM